MGLFLLITEALRSPTSTVSIMTILWMWTRTFFGFLDSKDFDMNYHDVVRRNQFWRIATYPFIHTAFFFMLFNVLNLWAFRFLESEVGALFFFRYSVVLIASQCALSLGFIKWIADALGSQISPYYHIANTRMHGFSGLLLAWAAYASLLRLSPYQKESGTSDIHFFSFLGLVHVSWPFAVLLLMVSILFIHPRESAIPNLTSLLSGYLLSFGVIQILPNTYWTVCLLMDALIFCALSVNVSLSARLLQGSRGGTSDAESAAAVRNSDSSSGDSGDTLVLRSFFSSVAEDADMSLSDADIIIATEAAAVSGMRQRRGSAGTTETLGNGSSRTDSAISGTAGDNDEDIGAMRMDYRIGRLEEGSSNSEANTNNNNSFAGASDEESHPLLQQSASSEAPAPVTGGGPHTRRSNVSHLQQQEWRNL